MEKEKISPIAAGILQGLEEATADAQGFEVEGIKKTAIYREQKILKKFIKSTGKNIKVVG